MNLVKPGFANENMVAAHTVLETLVWQGLASVLIPGFVINRVVWTTATVLKNYAT